MHTSESKSKLKVIEIGENNSRTIDIDPSGKFPVIIGRGSDAHIQIGLLGKHTFVKGPAGKNVTIAQCISKVQATIYRYDNGELRIHDGNGRASASGIRIFGSEEPIERPVPLSPGAHIDLFPRTKGYCCVLEWADSNTTADEPTLGFNRWNKALLEDDKRVLKDEKQELANRVRAVEIVNEAQDLKIRSTEKKLAQLKILGVSAVSAIAISMGISAEEIQTVVQIIAVVSAAAGGGFILQQKEA